jgi:hypothetical protein
MNPSTPADLVGKTWHLLNGSKYAGEWAITEAGELAEGSTYFMIKADKISWSTRLADCFETEDEARAEAKARRKPRQARRPQALYGDFGQLAAFHGFKTDGSGKRA